MVSVKLSVLLWSLLLLLGHLQCGESFFLGYKKDLLKHKLYKIKEALFSAHDTFDEVHHYHYKPYYISGYTGYSKYGWPSYPWSAH